MPVLPMIQLQDPRSQILKSLGEDIGGGLSKSLNNRLLTNLMGDVDINNPGSVQEVLNKTPPSLRPEIAGLLQQKQQFQQAGEERQMKIQNMETARDQNFSSLVNEKLGDLDDISKGSFVDISQKYRGDLNPEARYQKTLKDYTDQLKPVQVLGERLKNLGTFRKGVLGLRSQDIDVLSKNVDSLLKKGIDPRLIEKTARNSGISEMDFEAIMTPNFSAVKKVIAGIPRVKAEVIPGQAGITSFSPGKYDKQKVLKMVSKAIKRGGSLDYLYTELLNKRYNENEIPTIISEAAEGMALTARQEMQLSNLQRKRAALIKQIFGE